MQQANPTCYLANFQVFDENEEGVIDEEHLKKAMKNLGEPLSDKELDDMLKLADRDQDGKINYEGK